jgi:phosphatidylserine/phosphatidylglycerophosphate/cardiolipin synthase-like enzyme
MIPDRSDGPVVGLANWSFTRELLPAGVGVYRYEPAFMHQKVFLLDRELAGVGTANFDNRSFRLNFEMTALVHDADFCDEVERMLLADFEKSRLVTAEELAPNRWFPIAIAAARLMAPVLCKCHPVARAIPRCRATRSGEIAASRQVSPARRDGRYPGRQSLQHAARLLPRQAAGRNPAAGAAPAATSTAGRPG